MALSSTVSRSNWNLRNVGCRGRRKTVVPGEKPSEQEREPTTNSTYNWRQHLETNPGHIGGSQMFSPLPHPCFPNGGYKLPTCQISFVQLLPFSGVNICSCHSPRFNILNRIIRGESWIVLRGVCQSMWAWEVRVRAIPEICGKIGFKICQTWYQFFQFI